MTVDGDTGQEALPGSAPFVAVRSLCYDSRMSFGMWRQMLILGVGLAALIALVSLMRWDLPVSRYWYDASQPEWDDRWPLHHFLPLRVLNEWMDKVLVVLFFVPACVLLGLSLLLWRSPVLRAWRRPALVMVLAVVLGPGAIVNCLLKPLWGRPRPRQTTGFTGDMPYRDWWQPTGIRDAKGFTSGHVALTMSLMAVPLVCMRPGRRQTIAVWACVLLAGLMGFARLVQGQHFLTDVLWSMLLTLACVLVVVWAIPPPWAAGAQHDAGAEPGDTAVAMTA